MEKSKEEKISLVEKADPETSSLEPTLEPFPEATFLQKAFSMMSIVTFVCLDVVSSTCVTLLERRIPDFELNTIRTSGCLIACVLLFGLRRQLPRVPRSEICNVIMYGMSNVVTVIAIFSSVTFIPMSSMSCLRETFCIISGLILFRIFLKEAVDTRRAVLTIFCIVGVILVVQPSFIFPVSKSEAKFSQPLYDSKLFIILGYTLAIVAGVGNTADTLIGRKYPYIPDNYTIVVFWAVFIGFFSSAIAMLIFETLTTPRDWYDILLITGHTVGFILSFPTWVWAYRYISANTSTIILSTNVVLALIPQYTVLSSILPGHRNWIEVLGVVLVLVGCAMGSAIELLTSK